MAEFKTIKVDISVSRIIESARRSFGETENDILRRLLGIDSVDRATEQPSGQLGWTGVHQKSGKRVFLPDGTEMKATYNGQTIHARIEEERIAVNGKSYKAVSPALQENVLTKAGGNTSLNGWEYWLAKKPGEARYRSIVP